MTQTFNPSSESEWLQLRVFDITSTESPALFGLSPWSTARACAAAQYADDEKKSAKAELLLAIGDAEKVLLDGFRISASMRAPAEVKAYIRAGFRDFRITTMKEKA